MKDNSLWVLGHRISPVEVSGNYDMVIGETPPEVPGPPPHFHSALNEVFYVLEGEMEFMVNGEVKVLKKGDTIDLQPDALHTFKNDGTTTCKWVNIHSPKGFLAFFREMGIPENEPDAIKKSVDEHIIRRVMAEAASYDMHIKTEG